MAPISAAAVSGTLERAYRAALLLTGSAEFAEIAVLNGIASLELDDEVEQTLVATTVEFVIRRPDYEDGVTRALALLLHDELRRLVYLGPECRDTFLLRVLCGISTARSAAILKLTIEELEASLSAGLRRLCVLGCSDPIDGANTRNTGEQK